MRKTEWIKKVMGELPDDANIEAWNIAAHEPDDPKGVRSYISGSDTSGIVITLHVAQMLHSIAKRMHTDPQKLADTALKFYDLDRALGAATASQEKDEDDKDRHNELLAKLLKMALIHTLQEQEEDDDE